MVLAVIAALRPLATATREGDFSALALLAGIVGFLAVGLLGSTLDTARTGFIFYLVLASGLAVQNPVRVEAHASATGENAEPGGGIIPGGAQAG